MSLKEKIKNLESKYLLIEAQIRQETNTEKLDKLKKQRHTCFSDLSSLRKQLWVEENERIGYSDE